MSPVGSYVSQLRIRQRHKFDVLADETPKHLVDVRHDGVQVENLEFHELLAAEGQQLLRQRSRPVSRVLDFGDVGPQRAAGFQGAQQQFAVAQDRRQEIVEVMSHSTGESADRFHFLRLLELLFESLALSDVGRDAQDVIGRAVLSDDRPLDSLVPPDLPHRIRDHLLRDEFLAQRIHQFPVPFEGRLDLGRVGIEIRVSLADEILDRRAIGVGDSLVCKGETTLPVLGKNEIGIDVDDLPEKVALPFQRLLRPPALRDVANEAAESQFPAGTGGRDRQLHGKLMAVAAQRHDLDSPVQDGSVSGGQIPAEPVLVCFAQLRRDDHLGQRAAHGFFS